MNKKIAVKSKGKYVYNMQIVKYTEILNNDDEKRKSLGA